VCELQTVNKCTGMHVESYFGAFEKREENCCSEDWLSVRAENAFT